jgi:diguanylate cyclase (GGDEF)-like protein/PAS domain S-box-containing protein
MIKKAISRPRFALTRYFSLASIVFIVIVASLLGWSYQFYALGNLMSLAEDRNAALAQAFSNSLWPRFSSLVAIRKEATADAYRSLAERNGLYALAGGQMKGTDVIKVKIYSLGGLTVFSSDPSQTGEDKSDNPGFREAAAGRAASALTHRDAFDSFEGTVAGLDVIATYLPIRDAQEHIVAVFEIYSDVTELMARLRHTQQLVVGSVCGLLALLYALQLILVARAQRTIDRQEQLLEQSIADLDGRVKERTDSLAAINRSLLAEIEERKQVEATLSESTARYSAVTQSSNDAIVTADSSGSIVGWNKQAAAIFDYSEAEISGEPLTRVIPNLYHANPPKGGKSAANESLVVGKAFETEGRRKDQSALPIEVALAKWEVGGNQFVTSTIRDISEKKQAEHHLRVAATTFEIQEGVAITDADQVFLRVNRAFCDITGYSSEELVGKTPQMVRSDRHDPAFFKAMWDSINHTGNWKGEIWNKRRNGEVYPAWVSIAAVKGIDGRVSNYVGTYADITLRKAAEDEIAHLAFYDHLTDLPNRRLLLDRLRHALATYGRSGQRGALMFLDLDNFKTLNDTQGHDAGDQLLIAVAERLTRCVRHGDTVARLGGDEFVVMLEGLDDSEMAAIQTETIAEKIRFSLSQPYLLNKPWATEEPSQHTHFCSSSLGITLFQDESVSAEELMKRADTAMYQAKAAGRNTLRFFDPQMQATIAARAALDSDLRHAIEAGQLLLYYQPQVNEEGQLTGAEALIRWQHPRDGMVSPTTFIPLAEENGLILPIGLWVLETACVQLAAWAGRPTTEQLTIAVNVSAHQFRQRDFVDRVLATIEETGANPRRLKLELTESLLVHDVEEIIEKMQALKARGVGFSLDDFGTGYSSLSYLLRLPLDQLKIDQSFVRDILSDPGVAAVARTVVALGQSLGLAIIAEGVETAGQRDFLAKIGCLAYQGFFFSRPLPIERFEQFALTRQNRVVEAAKWPLCRP